MSVASSPLSSPEFIFYLLVGLNIDFDILVTSVTTRLEPLTPKNYMLSYSPMKIVSPTLIIFHIPPTSLPISLPIPHNVVVALIVAYPLVVAIVVVVEVVPHLILLHPLPSLLFPTINLPVKFVENLTILLFDVTINLIIYFKVNHQNPSWPTIPPFPTHPI